METIVINIPGNTVLNRCPHSLGKLIEWKLISGNCTSRSHSIGPHSLGKLIEWKHLIACGGKDSSRSPHSLGKLIEWKL